MRGTPRERLYSRSAPCPDPGCECLLWAGRISRNGYGHIKIAGKHRGVHRVAWELDNGPVPPGLVLDHVKARGCHHRHCINVAHLEPVTHQQNLLRGDTIAAAHAAKTHCPRGHPYSDANTYLHPCGTERGYFRACRTCRREYQADDVAIILQPQLDTIQARLGPMT